jgi:hypothetical protein
MSSTSKDVAFVMAGDSPSKDGRERPDVPAIHVFLSEGI